MDYLEMNERLRKLVINLEQSGFKKTNIGKALLGVSSYSQMIKWVSDDENLRTNFNVKPLSKIADLLNCELRLVMVNPKEDPEVDQLINNTNNQFLEQLRIGLIGSLNGEFIDSEGGEILRQNENKKTELDNILDNIV